MPKFIVHHDGWFFEWSTIVDAPTTEAMRREAFEEYYQDQHGKVGMRELPARLERAVKYGTSSMDQMSAEDLIAGNRAGDDETEMSFTDILNYVGAVKA